MAESRLPDRSLYPNNSNIAKERAATDRREERPPAKKVIKGSVEKRKKPIAKRFAEAFGAKEGQGVLEYIINDIIVPATKNMLLDSVSDGIEMALFGELTSRRNRRGYGRDSGPRYAYDRLSYNRSDRRDDPRERNNDRSRTAPAGMMDYEDIIFRSKDDADEVIAQLVTMIDAYGDTTVSDLYEFAGFSAEPQFRNYGWESLGSAAPRRVRDGYILDLPRPVLLPK